MMKFINIFVEYDYDILCTNTVFQVQKVILRKAEPPADTTRQQPKICY